MVDAPIVILSFSLLGGCYIDKIVLFLNIGMGFILLFEIVGIIVFAGRYARYNHSYADITLNTSEKLEGIEIDQVRRHGKWLIIQNRQEKRIILFDSIVAITYYGEPKIILINGYEEIIQILIVAKKNILQKKS